MNTGKLNQIIRTFIRNEGGTDLYRLGRCSEFAVALKKFLGGGTICKHGVWHTVLYWNGLYWDANGGHTKQNLKATNYISAGEDPRPATLAELHHINSLLNEDIVRKIVKGLKGAK